MGSVALTCHPSGMRFASALCRMVAQLSGVHCFPSCVVTETFNQLFCGRRLIKNMGLHVSACEPLISLCLSSIHQNSPSTARKRAAEKVGAINQI